jgi:hypothetical protein
MRACCNTVSDRGPPTWVRRLRDVSAWLLPSAGLVLMPKCPACLAAYVALGTGLGVSFSTATYLRWVVLFLCVASLLFLIVQRLDRRVSIMSYFKKETELCHTK